MAAGSIQTILICRIGEQASPHIPCPVGTGAVAIQAYVVDPAAADFFDSVVVPFDPSQAATFFIAGFCITIAMVWVAWQGGEILDMVKRILDIKR